MKLAIMQPYFFPYIGYFQLINAVERFVVYDDVNFIKQGWINRNFILAGKEKQLITIPVKQISSFKKINETEIDHSKPWAKKLLKTLKQNYQKAPQFETVFPKLEKLLSTEHEFVSDLARGSILMTIEHLGLETTIIDSSSIYDNSDLESENRVIDICKKEKASMYINPMGGKDLYHADHFEEHGIELRFIKPGIDDYDQGNKAAFVPSLSMIDVLMFNDPTAIRAMLGNYQLVE